ncbi:MAG: exodeoxyribonuclease V subunit gamma, partial [Acidobacteria bacterium]|nr:exodeoxyribonuclease V subunit gamma [Acidobacteriota bacterium]
MPGFNIYLSNRSEILVDALAHAVSSPPLPALEREIIVVQSKGMERWLVQQLSDRFGIWANSEFPFPNSVIQELFGALLGEIPPENPFSPDLLAWRIQRLLPGCLGLPGFESLKNYLADGKQGLKLAQLCYRVADAFDQYTLYRPEIILGWEQGIESHWQAQLWRKLVGEAGSSHRAAIRQRFFEKLRRTTPDASTLPARISIFGISALPAFHLDVFSAIARFLDVHLFLMNPSAEFWAEIVSEKEQSKWQQRRQREKRQMRLAFPANPYFETGHPLLASLGRQGRDFFGILLDRGEGQEWTHYEDPGEETLLACLQSDILNLRHRGKDGFHKAIAAADTSLQIHSSHGPMREMEVLYDQLLALFDEKPGLLPHDILVMTPDIEAYAPYISAVFGGERQERNHIPFSVSDRSARNDSPVVRAFFKLLDLAGSRLAAPAVMDLLDIALVRQRFGIRPEDREQLQHWVEGTRICWGVDGNDRAQHGVPAFAENSWRTGLDRLVLGYALTSKGGKMFEGVLPFDDVEGSTSQSLGRFVEFAETLFVAARDLGPPRTLLGWSESLLALVSQFLMQDEELEHDFQRLRANLRYLAALQQTSGYAGLLGLDVVRYVLEGQMKKDEWTAGFLTGGVTFCAMLPMRSIPFKVIALVGMNSKAFPRSSRPVGFDLIASRPRPGDRSLRDEDRYLFLEALLSAREKLYISYVGQSLKDNSEIPPSVIVSELLDVVHQGFRLAPGDGPILDRVCIRHKLQAFSSFYFSGVPGLFSYSQENLAALKARQAMQAGDGASGARSEPLESPLKKGDSGSEASARGLSTEVGA